MNIARQTYLTGARMARKHAADYDRMARKALRENDTDYAAYMKAQAAHCRADAAFFLRHARMFPDEEVQYEPY